MLTASFQADFSRFEASIQSVTVQAKTFDHAIKNSFRDLNRVVESFSGQELAVESARMVEAVNRLGGVSKLTDSEVRRLTGTLNEAAQKAGRLGEALPPSIAKMRAEIEKLPKPVGESVSGLGSLGSVMGKLGPLLPIASVAGLSAAVISMGKSAFSSASTITDLANKTGLSIEAIQRMQNVANQTGTSLDAFTNAAFKLGVNVSEGTKKARDAVNDLGLSYTQLKAQKPEEQFASVIKALEGVDSQQERNRIGVALFGRQFSEIAASIEEGYSGIANAARVSSDAQIKALDAAGDAWTQFADHASERMRSTLGQLVLFGQQATRELSQLSAGKALSVASLLPALVGIAGGPERLLAALVAGAEPAKKAMGDIQLGTAHATVAQRDFVKELAEVNAKIQSLTPAMRAQIDAASKLGEVTETQADAWGLSAAEVRLYTSSVKNTTAALKVNTKQAVDTGKANRQMWNEIGIAQQKYAREQMDRIAKIENDAAKALRQHLNMVGEFRMQFDRSMMDAASPKWLANMWVPLKEAAVPAGLEMGSTMGAGIKDGLMGVLGGAGGTLASAFTGGGGLGGALKAIGTQIAESITKPMAAAMTNSMRGAYAVGASAATAIGGAVGGGGGAAVAGLASGLGGAALAASAMGKSMAAAGVAGSLAMAGMTMGIGLAAVGIFKLIQHNRNLNKEVKEWNKKIDETRVKLLEMYGPLDALDKKAKALGMSSFTNEWFQQGEKGAAQFAVFIKEFEARLKKTNDSFAPLLSSATELGIRLPASILASIEQLRELGILSEENAALLDQLAGAAEVDWKKMQEAAKRYGIDLDSLGQQFQQLKFGDAAKQIINDFDLLSRGGADVGGILFGMQDEISALVQQAKKFGLDIPKNMQPWIEELLRAGLLTDENGELLQDLAGIRFAAPIKTEFERITEALEKLIETLNLFASTLGNLPKPDVTFPSNPNPHGGEFGGTSPWSPAALTPGETVLGRGATHDFLQGVRDGSGAQTINVPISLDGRVIADVVIERVGNRLSVKGAR